MRSLAVAPAALLLALSGVPAQAIYSFETCPTGPLTSCSLAEPWVRSGGVATVVPYGPVGPAVSGFPTDGLSWCIVHSAGTTGYFAQPAGGPALLPYAPGSTGHLSIPISIPPATPGISLSIFFDYTYVSPECPNDPTYNDCLSVDLTVLGVPVANLLYLDTYSAAMSATAASPHEGGAITAAACMVTREAAPAGAPKTRMVPIPASVYGQTVTLEVNVADGGDSAVNSWCYIDNIGLALTCPAPTISISQPGGPGTGVYVDNGCLIAGHEYFNVFSPDLCPGGPGTGPIAGLCFNDLNFLLFQLTFPLGVVPFHFLATGSTMSHGPLFLGGPFVLDCLCGDATGGLTLSAVYRGGGL